MSRHESWKRLVNVLVGENGQIESEAPGRSVQSDMAGMPPPGESTYPRTPVEPAYGSADRLDALASAYVGINWLVLLNAGTGVFVLDATVEHRGPARSYAIGLTLVLAAASWLPSRLLAFAMGWPRSSVLTLILLFGVDSTLCFGLLGYLGAFMMLAGELHRYELGTGLRSLKVRWIREAARRRKARDASEHAE